MAEAKVVLITGSSSGIGAETARLFAKRHFRVAITGSNQERLKQVAQECTDLSPSRYRVSDALISNDHTQPVASIARD
jgi:NADP-dependent 3-hydroxy acid dehydrogenase YdfG